MSEGSIVAIILAFFTFAGGFFVTLRGFRQDALNSALETIKTLQDGAKLHNDRMDSLEDDLDKERTQRRELATKLDSERIARESVEAKLRQTQRMLEETTQIKLNQAQRIAELEDRLKKVEKKTGPLKDPKEGE